MSTVSLPAAVIARSRELFVLYSKKAAFQIEEYADAGAVFARLTAAAKTEGPADVSEQDVKYLISAINICSQRVAIEAQNYKPVAELLEVLTAAVKTEEVEETKEEDEKSSVTEL